jgi:DeoR/GlpR family transcriptional regulator of sugar metabolism
MIAFPKEEKMDNLGASQRRSLILETLKRTQIVRVAELSQLFGVTMVSVRRDLEILEKNGHLRRIHGGAVPVQTPEMSALLRTRSEERAAVKERIGRAAAELIEKSDNIILDSGTTPLQVAKNIPNDLLNNGNLSVITNSLPIVHALGAEKNVHLIFLGGIFVPDYSVVVGPRTLEHIKTLHADKMFLGTDGLTFSQGITTANVLEAEVSQALVKASSEVIVVADSSKIGSKGLATIVPVTEIDKLITDEDAPDDFIGQLKDHGVEVIQV